MSSELRVYGHVMTYTVIQRWKRCTLIEICPHSRYILSLASPLVVPHWRWQGCWQNQGFQAWRRGCWGCSRLWCLISPENFETSVQRLSWYMTRMIKSWKYETVWSSYPEEIVIPNLANLIKSIQQWTPRDQSAVEELYPLAIQRQVRCNLASQQSEQRTTAWFWR